MGKGTFLIVGTDARLTELAELLRSRGEAVRSFPGSPGSHETFELACDGAAYAVLPVPMAKGELINGDFTYELTVKKALDALSGCRAVFAGMVSPEDRRAAQRAGCRIIDYCSSQAFQTGNAVLTAEGAVGLAIMSAPFSVWESRAVITGFGRIGSALAPRLSALGADVGVFARSPEQRMRAGACGCRSFDSTRLREEIARADLVFNTVPAPVLGPEELAEAKCGALFMELASSPGGIDTSFLRKMGATLIKAPGLPGRTAPVTAAGLIARAVSDYIDGAPGTGGEDK